jgi:hypothetical protein
VLPSPAFIDRIEQPCCCSQRMTLDVREPSRAAAAEDQRNRASLHARHSSQRRVPAAGWGYSDLPTTACRRRSIGVTIGTVSIVLAAAISSSAVKVSRVMTA